MSAFFSAIIPRINPDMPAVSCSSCVPESRCPYGRLCLEILEEPATKKFCIITFADVFQFKIDKILEMDITNLYKYNEQSLLTLYEICIPHTRGMQNPEELLTSYLKALLKEYSYRIIKVIVYKKISGYANKRYITEEAVELHHGFVDDEAVLTIRLNKRMFRISSNNTVTRKINSKFETFPLDYCSIDTFITMDEFEYLTFLIDEYKKITHDWKCYSHRMFGDISL